MNFTFMHLADGLIQSDLQRGTKPMPIWQHCLNTHKSNLIWVFWTRISEFVESPTMKTLQLANFSGFLDINISGVVKCPMRANHWKKKKKKTPNNTASLFCFVHPTHGFNMAVVTGRCKQSINGPLFQNPGSVPVHFKGPWAAEICEV